MTSSKLTPGRPRSDASRSALIEATFELLREVGYERLTMDAVAAKAGVGKATIYRWYPTKEDLVIEALGKTAPHEHFIPDTGSLAADTVALFEHILENDPLSLNRESCARTVSTLAGSTQLAQTYWDLYIVKKRATFSIMFERAKERGELSKNADIDLFMDLFHGYVLFGLLIRPNGEVKPKAITNVINRLLAGFSRD